MPWPESTPGTAERRDCGSSWTATRPAPLARDRTLKSRSSSSASATASRARSSTTSLRRGSPPTSYSPTSASLSRRTAGSGTAAALRSSATASVTRSSRRRATAPCASPTGRSGTRRPWWHGRSASRSARAPREPVGARASAGGARPRELRAPPPPPRRRHAAQVLDAHRLDAARRERLDLVAKQRPRRAVGGVVLVAGGGKHEQRAARSDGVGDGADRPRPDAGGQRLDRDVLDDEIERAGPLGRRGEQVGHRVRDARLRVALPREADRGGRDVEGERV